mgnify:CR=1 FL=1
MELYFHLLLQGLLHELGELGRHGEVDRADSRHRYSGRFSRCGRQAGTLDRGVLLLRQVERLILFNAAVVSFRNSESCLLHAESARDADAGRSGVRVGVTAPGVRQPFGIQLAIDVPRLAESSAGPGE